MDSVEAVERRWREESEWEAEEQRIARIITSSIAGSRWRDLNPIDIARHLVSNGVRVVIEVER